jgi:hypothetical protein
MNQRLKKEIILNIFNVMGVFRDKTNFSASTLIEPLIEEKFLLDKKLSFEIEDGTKRENQVFAATTKIDGNMIKVMIADIIDEIPEYAIIMQMDNFPSIAMRLSLEDDDYGTMTFHIENKWIEIGTSAQARVLMGIENLSEIFAAWERMIDYKDMYSVLISFLNYVEGI